MRTMGGCGGDCRSGNWLRLLVLAAAAVLAAVDMAAAQADAPSPSGGVPLDTMTQFNQVTAAISAVVQRNYSDCVDDAGDDTGTAFAYDQTSDVLLQCISDAGSDFSTRVCGQPEIELYFANTQQAKTAGIPPNLNCNPNDWTMGCEAGWAAATESNTSADIIPVRTADPKICCQGFFCPRGLTCMIPCPLGAWCPTAQFNADFDRCDPYGYPSKPGNSTACGGADVWLSYKSSPGTFCGGEPNSSGKYCPDTITQQTCEKGHYCRIGSTDQKKCTFLTQCTKDGMDSENLKSYGILLVAVLFVFLLLIYNCSEQVMHLRERRKSRVRDNAAREARESVSAVERWKMAKDAARVATDAARVATKRAVKLTNDMSRTLSRTRSRRAASSPSGRHNPSFAVPGGEGFYNMDYSGTFSGTQNPPHSGRFLGDQDEEEGGWREQEFHLLRDTSENAVGSNHVPWSHDPVPLDGPRHAHDLYDSIHVPPVVVPGTIMEDPEQSSSPETKTPLPTLAQTRSQIYKYAYGEIEKERFRQVQQQIKPASLAAVVDSNGFRDIVGGKNRILMELRFVDLSLTLKGSGQRILSHVTGNLSPCRVTAVMGPSGAGKTTFLNALAGKETGSYITGQVFINGAPGSIRSYKRIIGFVPQDDIVHGSLTVEENLTFSAKYRLPVNTPRQDRVLVVERIINRLGLTSIRDSLVGTVERRGISGGQRKRVNVGMELVMEPSLLILDEPTSGLDSTSSRLVVQSLRREATLGVNVCLVLHQPSYGLFRMFDDVMFLAKGGYTVYLGPVAEIEGYFSGMGFEVPDRANPPDYYMDVLEGLEAPPNDPSFDIAALPVLWMCHNGYHIPADLQESADRRRRSDPRRASSSSAPRTLARDLWDELRIGVLQRWDCYRTDLSTTGNLSGRQTPGFWPQFRLIFARVCKQKFRESRLVAQDYIILLLAGICLGGLADWKDDNLGGTGYLYTIIAVALLVMIASLRTFSDDKLEFWRESSSGINRVAFFLAKDSADHFNTLIKPLVYLSMFYFFNDPRSSFAANYGITLALVYCCTGLAYVLAIILTPQPAQLFAVFVPVIATLLVSSPRSGALETIAQMSYAYWAWEAYTIANAKRYSGVWLITRCEALRKYGYHMKNGYLCIGVLLGYGVGARIVAYFCLVVFHRKRQR